MKWLLLLIPCFLVICLWIAGSFHFVHYFTSINTQISLIDGIVIWIGPNPHQYKYPLLQALAGSFVFAGAVRFYRVLRNLKGLVAILVVLHIVEWVQFGEMCLCPFFLFDFAVALQIYKQYLPKRPAIELTICQQCGYDLRATPNRCPECGLEVFHIKPLWLRRDDARRDDHPE